MVMSFSPMSMGNSGNMYQAMRAKYSCGYADNAERPKVAPYPMEIIPKEPDSIVQKNWFGRFFSKLYSN